MRRKGLAAMTAARLASPLLAGAVTAALLSACAGPMAGATGRASGPDDAIAPATAVRTASWENARPATILLADFVVAPYVTTFVVGQPVRLTIRNTGENAHVFAAGAFFDAIAVRTVFEVSGPPVPAKRGYGAAKMEEIAFHGVGQLIILTPHEQDLARTSKNPFDRAPATPIDFGDLLGDLGALGADPFGLNAAKPPDPFGVGVPTPAPANPFDVLGAAGCTARPAPTPAAPTSAPAATAERAVDPGLDFDREGLLLKEWGPSLIASIDTITIQLGDAAQITFVPLRAGTYAVSAPRGYALLGMAGRVRIVSPADATAPLEVAGPAADFGLLGGETKTPTP